MAYTFRWVPTPGQDNGFVTNNSGVGRLIRDQTQQNPFDSPLYVCFPPTSFQGGDSGASTLYDFAKLLATTGQTMTVQNPAINYNGKQIKNYGNFTLNGNPCGTYEYNILGGGTTLTQAMIATLFSSTQDSVSSWIVCRGNLTIPDNIYLIPTNNASYTPPSTVTYLNPPDPNALRKLFMVVYVTGNLLFGSGGSTISMSACGANTDTTGANITSFAIPIATGIKNGGTVSPVIQATGAAGGAAYSTGGGYNAGSSASGSVSLLSTGGGSSGRQQSGGISGAGGSGSPFSGGAGGGGMQNSGTASAGSSRGGAGGSTPDGIAGTGNPGGNNGTGGVLVIICEGSVSGAANILANGVSGNGALNAGGSSGGGVAVVIQSASGGTFNQFYANGGYGVYGVIGGNGSTVTYGINS